MAQSQAREAGFNPSSPHSSSGGADSYMHEGTPDTRLTAFSPEENSAKSVKLINPLPSTSSEADGSTFSTKSTTPYRSGPGSIEKDPFISGNTPARKREQKLSAKASAFRPFSTPVVARGSTEPSSAVSAQALEAHQHVVCVSPALSTELHISRYLVVSRALHVAGAIAPLDVERMLSSLDGHGAPYHGGRQITIKGYAAYIRFTNIRDACKVHESIPTLAPSWIAGFVSPIEFVQITNTHVHPATDCEGQLSVFAVACAGQDRSAAQVEAVVVELLCSEGDVFALQRASSNEPGTFKAIVEYSDTAVAFGAVSKYNGATLDGINVIINFHKNTTLALQPDTHAGIATPIPTPLATPVRNSTLQDFDIFQSLALAKTPQSNPTLATPGHPTPPHVGLQVSPHVSYYSHPFIVRHFHAPAPYLLERLPQGSPTMASMPSYGGIAPLYPSPAPPAAPPSQQDVTSPRQLQPYNRHDGRRQNAIRVNRNSPYYNAAGHHNHVDVNRIREGIDVRTTIMLRNIPNKVDQAMLKRIVDESSWGKYDFMYLRIDFANDCNVGYAFINFVDPLDIIDFVNARGNQRWNCFKSDKVAEISYATIQGKDCLVQKFRNSSVMLEAPHYRPKLYFTSNGPMPEYAGEEEPFPEPDNQSKMKRSCENAEHVGLFTPNAGQHFRDEQRRRRSQYDRGTRLAALEEYDYETAIQQLYV